MTDVVLPNTSKGRSDANNFSNVYDNDKAIVDVVNGGIDNTNLDGAAGITGANIANGTVTDAKQEKPTTSGSLTSAGTVGTGSGFTARKTATGTYEVTLDVALATSGHMMVTLHESGGFTYVGGPSRQVFRVNTFDTGTTAADRAFGFLIKAS